MTIAAIATAVMAVATWRLIAPPRVGLRTTRVGLLKRLDNPHSRDPRWFRCLARFLGDYSLRSRAHSWPLLHKLQRSTLTEPSDRVDGRLGSADRVFLARSVRSLACA